MKIVADSSCELTNELKQTLNIDLIPFNITIEGKEFIDDEKLDRDDLLKSMRESEISPKTACPSPQKFLEAYRGQDDVFVITISSKLSGTYNSAVLAKEMALEENNNKKIHVFDSLSAVCGETLVTLKINDLLKMNLDIDQIIHKVEEYIKEMKTFFLLESLDNLVKAGRISKLVGGIASALSIKPVMGAEDGEIKLFKKIRGSKKAFQGLLDIIGEYGEKLEDKILGIAHCNVLEKAEKFKEEVIKKYNFKDIVIVDMKGLSSVYANEGGLVIAF